MTCERAILLFVEEIDSSKTVVWYDFSCPFSYLGLQRTAILVERGHSVVALPFQVDRELPAEGLKIRSRNGPLYEYLSKMAKEMGVPLRWSLYAPNTRGALACAEWVRVHQPQAFACFQKSLFEAHFVLGENIGDPAVVDRHAAECGIDPGQLHSALHNGSVGAALRDAERFTRDSGVKRTPAWRIGGQFITELLPAEEFERLAGGTQGGGSAGGQIPENDGLPHG